MDARKYASRYVKPDNVRDGPIQTRVLNVFEGTYGRRARARNWFAILAQ